MGLFIFWLFFSIAVGFIAKERGRNPFAWGVLAGVISPLIAVIVLFVMDDESTKNEDDKQEEPLTLREFVSKIESYKDLYIDGVLTDEEYSLKKSELIKKIGKGGVDAPTEEFLEDIKYLRDEDVIDKKEVRKLKSFVL